MIENEIVHADPDPRESRRARFARRVTLVAAFLMMTIGLITVIYGVVLIRSTQLEGTPTGRKLVASSERILDCTDPEGECTKRNQAATAEVVGDIQDGFIKVVAAAAACSVDLDADLTADQREDQISACITKRLAANEP